MDWGGGFVEPPLPPPAHAVINKVVAAAIVIQIFCMSFCILLNYYTTFRSRGDVFCLKRAMRYERLKEELTQTMLNP